jgi:hypothetical protein
MQLSINLSLHFQRRPRRPRPQFGPALRLPILQGLSPLGAHEGRGGLFSATQSNVNRLIMLQGYVDIETGNNVTTYHFPLSTLMDDEKMRMQSAHNTEFLQMDRVM